MKADASQLQVSSSLGWRLWRRFIPPSWRAKAYQILMLYCATQEVLSYTFRFPLGLFAKLSWGPDEGFVMDFVGANTSVPVPTVVDIVPYPFRDDTSRRWIIIMTRPPGIALWRPGFGHELHRASDKQLAGIKHTIADWISQLRALPSPHGSRVCGFLGGQFMNPRLDHSDACIGPYESVADFHRHPYCTLTPEILQHWSAPEAHIEFVRHRLERHYAVKLVHGDLLLHNILADENFRLTGLVDWECAGWLPEYWENASSTRYSFGQMLMWKDIVQDAFPPGYEDDLAMEKYINMTYIF